MRPAAVGFVLSACSAGKGASPGYAGRGACTRRLLFSSLPPVGVGLSCQDHLHVLSAAPGAYQLFLEKNIFPTGAGVDRGHVLFYLPASPGYYFRCGPMADPLGLYAGGAPFFYSFIHCPVAGGACRFFHLFSAGG